MSVCICASSSASADSMCMRKKQILWPGLTMLSLVLLFGCESSGPAARRRTHAREYEALSEQQKASVVRGALSQGMTTNAVLIAWGQPTIISTVSTPNGPFVFWEYYRKRVAPELSVRREVIVPRSSTPVPESRVFPAAANSPSPPVVEWLDRTAVFHDERLVNWSPK